MCREIRRAIRYFAATFPAPDGPVLDIGGYDVNGNVQKVLPQNKIYTVDVKRHVSVDVVADVHELPFAYNTFGAVWSTSTLQYVGNPFKVVGEAYRVLKPGGIAYLEAPMLETPGLIGLHWEDAPAQDAFRIFPKGMTAMIYIAGFSDVHWVGPYNDQRHCWGVAVK